MLSPLLFFNELHRLVAPSGGWWPQREFDEDEVLKMLIELGPGPFLTEAEWNQMKLSAVVQEFDLDRDTLVDVMKLLRQELKNGLGVATQPTADVKMFPTYVKRLPSGNEKGEYLALDLGGTNFRVLLIRLDGELDPEIRNRVFAIPQSVMLGSGDKLFDHIVDCIVKFLTAQTDVKLVGRHFPLGFTFSFPCKQLALDSAELTTWTKGFKCSGVEGQDVVKLFQAAFQRRTDTEFTVKCVALINDTVGCLMSCAHKHPDTRVGLILGTGTNACYVEQQANIPLATPDNTPPPQMIINTEWGAFGNNGCLDTVRTRFDLALDREHTLNPGKQIYEKMISGMYMGELVRLVLEDLTREGLIFSPEAEKTRLFEANSFPTKYLSEIERAFSCINLNNCSEEVLMPVKDVLHELGIMQPSDKDCHFVHDICQAVSTRAAQLAAVGIATLLNLINEQTRQQRIVVGVDGSLYRHHPNFKKVMVEQIKQLINKDITMFQLVLSEDGSGKGAALVAAATAPTG